jgi:hypothetical protein
VTLRILNEPLPAGPRIGARRGDFVFEGSGLRVAVGGMSRSSADFAGALLDVSVAGWNGDALGDLREVVEIDGRRAALSTSSMVPELGAERPVLSIVRQTVDSRLALTTRIEAIPGENRISISTLAKNRSRSSLRVRLGDRLRWFGAAPFAPRAGFVENDVELRVPWFARVSKQQAFAFACESSECAVRFNNLGQGVDEQVALAGEVELPPDASATHSRSLLAVEGGLGKVAEIAWRLRRVPIGSVVAKLSPAPSWAIAEARDAEGRLILSEEVKGGEIQLPLPAGTYVVTLRGPGGKDHENVQVRAGTASPVALILPTAARVSYRITDDQGKLLAARMVFRGVAPTNNPDLGPWHSAAGAANVACTATGEGTQELPPGRYKILVTHGIEYDLNEQEITVSKEEGAVLRASLRHVVDTPGFISADLHLHADPSGDSEVPLKDRVISLMAEGVDLAAATDHNHITDYAPAVLELDASDRISTLPGIELTTSDWGHFNAYPYAPTLPMPPVADTAPDALFAFVRSNQPQATIQVNHPRMGQIGYFNAAQLDENTLAAKAGFSWDFDVLEVFNGFDLMKPDVVERNMLEWMRLMQSGHRYTAVGNSDAHRVVYEWAGYPRTYLAHAGDKVSPERAMTALKQGRAMVTSGPFIRLIAAGRGPGDVVRPENGKLNVDLDVRAPTWIGISGAKIWVDGKPVLELDASQVKNVAGASRLRHVIEVAVARDTFIIATARGAGLLADVLPGTTVQSSGFTNPVFVDGDGDGKISLTAP